MALPDRTTREWREIDGAHHIHPFTDNAALARDGGPRVITRAEGVWLEDSDGERLLDGLAGLWCVALGYGRKELADAAARQMTALPYYNTFLKTATPPVIELSRMLTERTPEGLDQCFFASSGSEANDTIVKLIRRFWQLEGKPEKRVIVSREFAYHGSTTVASSLGGMSAMHAQDTPLPDFRHVMPPYGYRYREEGESDETFGVRAADALEAAILEEGPGRVAAFFGEPVQGAGGVLVPPDSYWPRVQEICRAHDVLLVADEVITGFGRTGSWFGCDTYGIRPDFMTIAKAITSGYLPLSAAVVGERVAARLADGGALYHGFTYSGHPTACAVGVENLRLLAEEGLVERVRERTGPLLARRLHEAFDDHPFVGDVRCTGLLAAVELSPDPATRARFEPEGSAGARALAHAFACGVVARQVRDALCVSPPLVISPDEIDELVRRLREAVDRTARDHGPPA